LPFIDTILVKTQFLVFNNQFLDSLGLVKIILFDLMKHHFDYKSFPGISYELPIATKEEDKTYELHCVNLVEDLEKTIREFRVKFSAAYARLRIERKASGDNFREQMENVLPKDVREKEEISIDMPKTVRINTNKTSNTEVAHKLKRMGFHIVLAKYRDLSEEQQE
jgi:hypothetical protein